METNISPIQPVRSVRRVSNESAGTHGTVHVSSGKARRLVGHRDTIGPLYNGAGRPQNREDQHDDEHTERPWRLERVGPSHSISRAARSRVITLPIPSKAAEYS